MKFSLVDEIPHPRTVVFSTHRDKLIDLVPYLLQIESIQCESRTEEGAMIRMINHWQASAEDIPAPIRPFLKPERLSWVDRAAWDGAKWRCDWEITISALPEAVTARGSSIFLAEGEETIVQMTGEFLIHPDRIPGVPTFVAKATAPTLERFIVGLLQPNLRRSNQAVRQYIEDHL